MSGEMDWSPNYCLNCDKQTHEPHYCSQSCRLADLEKSLLSSHPATPNYSSSSSSSSSAGSPYSTLSFAITTPARASVQVHLPPTYNFAAHRQHSTMAAAYSPPASPHSRRHHTSTIASRYHTASRPSAAAAVGAMPALQRASTTAAEYSTSARSAHTLYSSASRSSLSSLASTSTSGGMSEHALSELQKYSNAFDHLRDYRRRVTLG